MIHWRMIFFFHRCDSPLYFLRPKCQSVSVPLPTASGSTAACRSLGSAAGHMSPGLWVCGAACTCCRARPQLWPQDQCCCKRRSASSGHGRRSWSTEEAGGRIWTQTLINDLVSVILNRYILLDPLLTPYHGVT